MKHLRTEAPVPEAAAVSRERVPYWDNVKLILIFLVVLGHMLYSRTDLELTKLLTVGIYAFHMPAFALVSGYFSTSAHARSKERIVPLLAAFVTFNGLFILYSYLMRYDLYLTIPYYSMWWLLALVFWRLTVPHVAKVPGSLLWTIAAAVLVGFWPDADNHLAVSRIVAFYPFFLAGYRMREKGLGQKIVGMGALPKALCALLCWAAVVAGFYLANRYLHFDYANTEYDPYLRMMDMVPRVAILAIACVGTLAVLMSAPRARLGWLSTLGANSLSIYLLHRYLVLGFQKFLAPGLSEPQFLLCSLAGSLVLLLVCGNKLVSDLVNRYLDAASGIVLRGEGRPGALDLLLKGVAVLVVAAVAVVPVLDMRRGDPPATKSYEIYPRLTREQEAAFDDSLTILFSGDLTLLEDQVRSAYTGEGYDFAPVFQYTKPYIEQADLAIGVLEGPCAGADAGYSSGNFTDDKAFWLNFPDEFAASVKDAGFDLVTTATNHMLDRGEEGALRTLDVLDGLGLDHTGTYRDAAAKESGRVHLVERDGIKMAVLAYTYGVNDDLADYPDDSFVGGEYAWLTSTIVPETSASFGAAKAAVEADFAEARELGADLIVVLPHWGTQFTNEPDEFQKTWRSIFLEQGADIILGAHTHDVQPIVMEEVGGRQTLTCYCPGNYCDLYREYDGDCSALVEVHVDRQTKEILGGSIIPLWTSTQLSGTYRAVPVGEIVSAGALRAETTNYDLLRVEEVQELATSVMLGTELDLQMARVRQPFTVDGFARASVPQIEVGDEERAGTLANALAQAKSVCFAGDFATAGSRNGGYGWYEPIESLANGPITNVSESAATVQTLIERADELAEAGADLYVVAIGANDIRYREEPECAMTAEAYVERLGELVDAVRAGVPQSRFLFVAPWSSSTGDPASPLMVDEKRELGTAYTEALKSWCAAEGFGFVDPNRAIEDAVDHYPDSRYLVDAVQPNNTAGIELFARSALRG